MSRQPTIVLATSELMLQSRLTESLKQLGYDVLIGDTGEALCKAFAAHPAAMILDLQSSGDPLRLVSLALEARIPVLAYGQHTKADELRRAREAGATVAVPRSQLVEDLPGLLAQVAHVGFVGDAAP